jgi:hypothetical protein
MDCPRWPPDLFAVVATIIERSGCYARRRFTAPWLRDRYVFDRKYIRSVRTWGQAWGRSRRVPAAVQKLWQQLAVGNHRVSNERGEDWQTVAMTLLAVADEACEGVGFATVSRTSSPTVQSVVFKQHREYIASRTSSVLPGYPNSICLCVPKTIACVQPKAITPSVGCTLRSLSHHLALLPPFGTVATYWAPARLRPGEGRPFTALLVPFPFVVHGRDFIAVRPPGHSSGYFDIAQRWLVHRGKKVSASEVSRFICDLINQAKREVGHIHAVVLPEAALEYEMARLVAQDVAYVEKGLELFITGALYKPKNPDERPLNTALAYVFDRSEQQFYWYQAKHHRWCLDGSQIPRYHLGEVLDPGVAWWEQIDVGNRECFFTLVRPGAILSVLICEDLARFDPLLPVISSVGPNLVVALLMDGPQMERRWPGRYATVLAEDPGSSVLTFTCLGMAARSGMPGQAEDRRIGLWKEPGGAATELVLPSKCHGLALNLSISQAEQFTLDGRSDHATTCRFRLSAVRGVRLSKSFEWLGVD